MQGYNVLINVFGYDTAYVSSAADFKVGDLALGQLFVSDVSGADKLYRRQTIDTVIDVAMGDSLDLDSFPGFVKHFLPFVDNRVNFAPGCNLIPFETSVVSAGLTTHAFHTLDGVVQTIRLDKNFITTSVFNKTTSADEFGTIFTHAWLNGRVPEVRAQNAVDMVYWVEVL